MALLSSLFKKINASKRPSYHVFFAVPFQTKSIAYEQFFFSSLTSSCSSNIEILFLYFSPENLLHLLI